MSGKVINYNLMGDSMQKYFFHHPDLDEPTTASYSKNKVTLYYCNKITVSIEDTGNGYEIKDTNPGSGNKKISIDYSLMADIMAALKIFERETRSPTEINYWTIYRGEKL